MPPCFCKRYFLIFYHFRTGFAILYLYLSFEKRSAAGKVQIGLLFAGDHGILYGKIRDRVGVFRIRHLTDREMSGFKEKNKEEEKKEKERDRVVGVK